MLASVRYVAIVVIKPFTEDLLTQETCVERNQNQRPYQASQPVGVAEDDVPMELLCH